MLFSALKTSLAILMLRAGPQDMPFDTGPRLLRQCMLLAAVTYTLFWLLIWPVQPPAVGLSVALAAATVGAQALTVLASLSARKLNSRYQQSLTALLLVNAIVTLPMLPCLVIMRPYLQHLHQVLELLLKNNEALDLLSAMDQLSKQPSGPSLPPLIVNLLVIWQTVVSVRVLGQSTNMGAFGGTFLLLLSLVAFALLSILISPWFVPAVH